MKFQGSRCSYGCPKRNKIRIQHALPFAPWLCGWYRTIFCWLWKMRFPEVLGDFHKGDKLLCLGSTRRDDLELNILGNLHCTIFGTSHVDTNLGYHVLIPPGGDSVTLMLGVLAKTLPHRFYRHRGSKFLTRTGREWHGTKVEARCGVSSWITAESTCRRTSVFGAQKSLLDRLPFHTFPQGHWQERRFPGEVRGQ